MTVQLPHRAGSVGARPFTAGSWPRARLPNFGLLTVPLETPRGSLSYCCTHYKYKGSQAPKTNCIMRSILVLAGIALAQEQQQAAAPADEQPAPIVCPVRGGGYDDRYAVAQLLILQKNIPQAEACLLEAVQV